MFKNNSKLLALKQELQKLSKAKDFLEQSLDQEVAKKNRLEKSSVAKTSAKSPRNNKHKVQGDQTSVKTSNQGATFGSKPSNKNSNLSKSTSSAEKSSSANPAKGSNKTTKLEERGSQAPQNSNSPKNNNFNPKSHQAFGNQVNKKAEKTEFDQQQLICYCPTDCACHNDEQHKSIPVVKAPLKVRDRAIKDRIYQDQQESNEQKIKLANTSINYSNNKYHSSTKDQYVLCNCCNMDEIRAKTARYCTGKLCTCTHDDHKINHVIMVGVLKIHPKGFGFIEAGGESYYVSPDLCSKCINNCEVSFTPFDNGKGKQAQVKCIQENNLDHLIACITSVNPLMIRLENDILQKEYPATTDFLEKEACNSNTFQTQVGQIYIVKPKDANAVLSGESDSIVFELLNKISEPFEPAAKWRKILAQNDLPFCIREDLECDKCPDLDAREDLTDIPFISIDSENTLDVDDLLYTYRFTHKANLEKTLEDNIEFNQEKFRNIFLYKDHKKVKFKRVQFSGSGSCLNKANLTLPENTHFILAVGIADPGATFNYAGEIDNQAKEMTATIYIPGVEQVSMLPHKVIFENSSLLEDQERAGLVYFIYFDREFSFIAIEPRIAKIKNHKKLSYELVDAYLTNDQKDKFKQEQGFSDELALQFDNLKFFGDEREIWRKKHDLATNASNTSTEYTIDEKTNRCVNIEKKELLSSHKIVSECMLSTNTFMAMFCRHNDIKAFYMKQEGIKINERKNFLTFLEQLITNKHLNELIPFVKQYKQDLNSISEDKFAFRKVRNILEQANSEYNNQVNIYMQQGNYTLEPDSVHQGLGEDVYLTVTSPIRKYMDLFNQRNIVNFLEGKEQILPEPEMIKHVNQVKSNIKSAIREIREIWNIEYLEDHVSEVFEVEFIKVTDLGISIRLVKSGIHKCIIYTNDFKNSTDLKRLNFKPDYEKNTVQIGDLTLGISQKFYARLKFIDKKKCRAIFTIPEDRVSEKFEDAKLLLKHQERLKAQLNKYKKQFANATDKIYHELNTDIDTSPDNFV